MPKRCFVVGNGPSLLDTPLERLVAEYTFATNRITQIYPHTSWRPTHYVRVETPNQDDPEDYWNDCRWHIEQGITCTFPTEFRSILGEHSHVNYVNTCHHYKYPAGHRKAPRAWHLPFICDFGTAVTVCIQLAFLAGFDVIYLVGCDLGYSGKGDHFYDSSQEHRQPPEQANANMQYAHELARRCCPVPIYNATRGGNLMAYPRINLERIL